MKPSRPPVARTTLRHNPLNAVTASVERVTDAGGRTVIRKELRGPGPHTEPSDPWGASDNPRHWNYWRRELEVYQDPEFRRQLQDTGLYLPAAEVEELPRAGEVAGAVQVETTAAGETGGAVIWLEDVHGLPGADFSLADHAVLAEACGRWQARPADPVPWTSSGFLRDYSTTRVVPWQLLDDDAAWRQPLIADHWPPGLRTAWTNLIAHRNDLLELVERLPRARCHLDLWVSNVIRRPTGELALLDWAFTGDGALGEDIGNHIPDAVLDLFWPAERMPELAETCTESYLAGLQDAGWRGNPDQVRLAVMASGVKYAWLLPHLLGRASNESHHAYHQQADSQYLFQQRGQALAFIAGQCAEALSRVRR